MGYGLLLSWLDLPSCSLTLLPFKVSRNGCTQRQREHTLVLGELEVLNPSPTEDLFASQHDEMSTMCLCSIGHLSFCEQGGTTDPG